MKNTSYFLELIHNFENSNKAKFYFFEKNFAFSIFFLFLGFVCGNLFGTFLTFFRTFAYWDGAIIASTILFIEFINFLAYKKIFKKNIEFQNLFEKKTYLKDLFFKTKNRFVLFLNFYKIGLLFGFFTDAFKVGS